MDRINRFLISDKTGKLKLILLYRYFSLAITSLFFLFMPFPSSIVFRLGVTIGLVIAAIIVKDLLTNNDSKYQVLKVLVIVETIGITLLLLPTGGIESPFIWYALNPVLVSASYLTGKFTWGLLFLYMTASTIISQMVFMSTTSTYAAIFIQNSYLFLALVLTTIVFQLFATLTNELKAKAKTLEKKQYELQFTNEKLTYTNAKSKEAMEHIMSLYQTVEFLTSQDNIYTLVETVLDSINKLTKSTTSFCWLSSDNLQESYFLSKPDLRGGIKQQVLENWQEDTENLYSVEVSQRTFQLINIQSTKYKGFIGIEKDEFITELDVRLLKFLVDLSSVTLERFYLKETSDQFLIVEEQNRIANEIHDSVSQRIFGIVYGLHSLKKNVSKVKADKLAEEIQFLSNAASAAMNELRSSIYQLSMKKRGEFLLHTKVSDFLEEVERIHEVAVATDIHGDEEKISYSLKNAIYRIISEACGNALKHSRCKFIKVILHITNSEIYVSVQDNGIGFNMESVLDSAGRGIGIKNMENLVNSFGGKITIQSELHKGTNVSSYIPIIGQRRGVVGL